LPRSKYKRTNKLQNTETNGSFALLLPPITRYVVKSYSLPHCKQWWMEKFRKSYSPSSPLKFYWQLSPSPSGSGQSPVAKCVFLHIGPLQVQFCPMIGGGFLQPSRITA